MSFFLKHRTGATQFLLFCIACLPAQTLLAQTDSATIAEPTPFEILIWTEWDAKKQAHVSILQSGESTSLKLGEIRGGTEPLAITNANRSRLVVRFTRPDKRDEIVVYCLPDLTEVSRHQLGRAYQRKLGPGDIRPDLFEFFGDENRLVTLSYESRQWQLHTVELEAAASIQSIQMPKGVLIGRVFPDGLHVAIATAKSVSVVNLGALQVVDTHNFPRKAYFDLLFDPDQPVLHVLERMQEKLWREQRTMKLRNRERLTLVSMDARTGKKQTKQLGFESPIVISHPDNRSTYVAAKASPNPASDLRIWKLGDGSVSLVHELANERDAFSLFVYEPADRLVLFYVSTDDLVYSLSGGEQMGTLRTPVKPATDPLIRDQRYAYLTSSVGSIVSGVDLKEVSELGAATTGRTGIKVLQGAVSILGITTAQLYGIGFAYMDFASARTRLQYDAETKRLLVLNTGTNDISVLDADTLETRGYVPVGGGAIGMFGEPGEPVVALSTKRLTAVDPASVTELASMSDGELVGLNAIEELAYFKDRRTIRRYSLEEGRALAPLEMPGRVLLVSGPTGSRSAMETFDVPALRTYVAIGYGPRGARLGTRGAFISP